VQEEAMSLLSFVHAPSPKCHCSVSNHARARTLSHTTTRRIAPYTSWS